MANTIIETNNLTSTSIPVLYIRYFNPKIRVNSNITIRYYVSDSKQAEYLEATNNNTFTTVVNINGKKYSKDTKAGEQSISIGSISTTGETYFSIYTIDNNGVASIEQFFDILVIDSSYDITSSQTYNMTSSDLSIYNIKTGESVSIQDAKNNNSGLINLFKAVKNNGYKKIVMLNNVYMTDYHADKITVPDNFTVDMNNATFKATQCTDLNIGNIVDLRDCFDSHVINGKLIGNYDGFDFEATKNNTNYYIPGEGLAVGEMNGAKYSSFENMEMGYSVGYNLGVMSGKNAGYTGQPGKLAFNNGCYLDSNGNAISSSILATTDLVDITTLLDRGEIQCSVYLNYGGLKLNKSEIFIHFYNSSSNYMKTVKTRQYQTVKVPSGAQYVRVTGFTSASTSESGLSVCHSGASINCELINVRSHNTRTCAMHPGIYNHLLIKNCTFDYVADENTYKVTKLALDFEDGYENGRNLFFINNEVYKGTSALTIQRCFNCNVIKCRNFGLDIRGHIKGAYIENNFFNTGDIYTTDYECQSHMKLDNNTFTKLLKFSKWDNNGDYPTVGFTHLDCKTNYSNSSNTNVIIDKDASSNGSGGGEITPEKLTISDISNITQTAQIEFYIEYSTNIAVTKHEVSWDGGNTFYDKTEDVTSSGTSYKFKHDDKGSAGIYRMAIKVTTAAGKSATSNVFTVTLKENGSSGGGSDPSGLLDSTGAYVVDDFSSNTIDSNKWGYELGYVRNGETQRYTNTNAEINDGILALRGLKASDGSWTSASIISKGHFAFMYGKIVARVRACNYNGSFGAFWTLGDSFEFGYKENTSPDTLGEWWAYCGEFDVMEFYSGKLTCGTFFNEREESGRVWYNNYPTGDWHEFAMEWNTDGSLIFSIDGNELSRTNATDNRAFHIPHFILVNQAIGASGGNPDSNTTEITQYVDWVKYYPLSTDNLVENSSDFYLEATDPNDSAHNCMIRPKFNDNCINKSITWQSSNPSLVTCHSGLCGSYAGANGEVVITGTSHSGVSKQIALIVIDGVLRVKDSDGTAVLTINNIPNIMQTAQTEFYIEYSTDIAVVKHEVSWDGGNTFYDKTEDVTSSGTSYKFKHDNSGSVGTYKMAIKVTTSSGKTATSNIFTVTLVDNNQLIFTQYKRLNNGMVTGATDGKYYSTVNKISVTPSRKYTLDLNPVNYVCVCFYNSSDTYLGNDSGGYIENNTSDWSVGSLSTTFTVPSSASYIRICGTSDGTQVTGTLKENGGSGDGYREGRTLIWEDDFTGTTLNTANWDYENNYSRPNEVQNYVAGTNNVWVENSNLVIKAKRESSNGKEWSSGCIHTDNKREFMYGRFEAKIKIPQTVGSFPAFWTLGGNYEEGAGITWPYCGEIDIMEHKQGYAWTTAGALYRTDLVWDNWDAKDLGRVDSGNIGSFDDYHIYAMEWTANKLDYYVDDRLIGHSDISDDSQWFMFHQPHYILLNQALGAAGGSVPSNMTEYTMYVDWVRVYAPEETPSGGGTTNRIWFEDTSARHMDKWSKLGLILKFNESWTNKVVTWKSSNDNIATVRGGRVDSKGVDGSCIITATTLEGNSASITVNVGSGGSTSSDEYATSCTSAYILDKMYPMPQNHEALPNGVTDTWATQSRWENQQRPTALAHNCGQANCPGAVPFRALGAWSNVYRVKNTSFTQNTGVEMRNIRVFGWYNGQWEKVQDLAVPNGNFYAESFSGDSNQYFSDSIKTTSNSKTIILREKNKINNENCMYHPFSDIKNFDSKYEYVYTCIDLRKVKWDENGVDDRDNTHYCSNCGGDWWLAEGLTFDSSWQHNKGIAQPKIIEITNEWKRFSMTTVPQNWTNGFPSENV